MEEEEDTVESSQPPLEQRRRRRRKKVVEATGDAPASPGDNNNDDITLQGDSSWASQVENEEEKWRKEAATASSNLEALTASEKEEEKIAAEIRAEAEESAAKLSSALAEAALFSASQSFIATSTPTHGKGGNGDLPSSVESGSFILTPEMISCVSSLTSSTINDNSNIIINPSIAGGTIGASPSLPSGQVAVIVTPAPEASTAAAAAASAAPPDPLGAAAPPPRYQHLSSRLQALGSAAISALATPAAPKMAISRLPPKDSRNRSASLKRARGDETLDDDDASSNAKRNLSVGRDGRDASGISQRDLMALMKQPGQQQQRQSRAQSRGGQKGGRGGL